MIRKLLGRRLAFLAVISVLLWGVPLAPAMAAPASPMICGTTFDYGYFDFTESGANNNLTLSWKQGNSDTGCLRTVKTWRSGSGQPGGTDECKSNVGWLPKGWYNNWGHPTSYTIHDSSGNPVWTGVVWRVADKKCNNSSSPYNGTVRTELFIHSRTNWTGTGSYYSNGCVKLDHADIADANSTSMSHNGPGYSSVGTSSRSSDLLYVH